MGGVLIRIAGGSCALAVLAGCGVTIEARKATTTADGSIIDKPGIVYALPKTVLEISQPVTLKTPQPGLAGVWASCLSACEMPTTAVGGDRMAVIGEACKIDRTPKLTFGRAELKSRTVADRNHLYQVDAQADWFQTLNVKFEVAESGTLVSGSSEATNTAADIASKVVTTAIDVAGVLTTGVAPVAAAAGGTGTTETAAAAGPQWNAAPLKYLYSARNATAFALKRSLIQAPPAPKQRDCLFVATDASSLNNKGEDAEHEPTMSCSLAQEVKRCLMPKAQAVDILVAERSTYAHDGVKNKSDADALVLADTLYKEQIGEAIATLKKAREQFGLTDPATKESQFVLTVQHPELAEATSAESVKSIIGLAKDKERLVATVNGVKSATPLSLTSGDAGATGDTSVVEKLLSESKRKFSVTIAAPASIGTTCAQDCGPATELTGLRYRVPRPVQVEFEAFTPIEVEKKSGPGTDIVRTAVTGPVRESKLIAQYGAIGALNSRFKGQGGKVVLKIWPDSGGIQSVEIGSTALPTSTVTGPLEEAFKQYKARKDAAATAAAAAASADAELDALTAEEAKLALKAKIKEHQDKINGK